MSGTLAKPSREFWPEAQASLQFASRAELFRGVVTDGLKRLLNQACASEKWITASRQHHKILVAVQGTEFVWGSFRSAPCVWHRAQNVLPTNWH